VTKERASAIGGRCKGVIEGRHVGQFRGEKVEGRGGAKEKGNQY